MLKSKVLVRLQPNLSACLQNCCFSHCNNMMHLTTDWPKCGRHSFVPSSTASSTQVSVDWHALCLTCMARMVAGKGFVTLLLQLLLWQHHMPTMGTADI